MPRGTPSSYAPKSTVEITRERYQRERLSAARQRRRDDALEAVDEQTLAAMLLYQREKRRAAAKGKPTLPTLDEYRNGQGEVSE